MSRPRRSKEDLGQLSRRETALVLYVVLVLADIVASGVLILLNLKLGLGLWVEDVILWMNAATIAGVYFILWWGARGNTR